MNSIISQPRYLPVLNYLQRIHAADVFVFLDDVQRQGRGVENRNKILFSGKERWLTIPIGSSSREHIAASIISGNDWVDQHIEIICLAYKKHPFFDAKIVYEIYESVQAIKGTPLMYVAVVEAFLTRVCTLFDLKFNFVKASELDIDHTIIGPQHLRDILVNIGADLYISGANGANYGIEDELSGIIPVVYNVYTHRKYHQYAQKDFVPWLSFFDALFNIGLEKTRDIIVSPLDLVSSTEMARKV